MAVHDPRAEGRLARRLFSAAFMSDTKWRKLIAVIEAECPDIDQMQVKFVDSYGIRTMQFPPSLSCPRAYADTIEFGPIELRSIEWLELPADVSSILRRIGQFPIVVAEGKTRIIGYESLRPPKGN